MKCVKPQSPQRFKRFFLKALSALCGREHLLLTFFTTPVISYRLFYSVIVLYLLIRMYNKEFDDVFNHFQ